jgi:hypothetical protein
MELSSVVNTSSTFSPVLAEVSINDAIEPLCFHSLTNSNPDSCETRRFSFKSVLFPISIT